MRAKSASPQETPTLASPGPTKQELQQQIDELNAVLRVTEEQRDAAYRELWKAADSSGRDLWNTYFGLLLGRAEKIEQFQKTVEEAEIAYESGKVVWGVSKTWEAMKQLGELVQREVGTVASVEIPKMPTNEKEARAFAKDVLEKATELGSDARAYLRKLGSAGDAMQQLEDDNVNIAQLKREISDLDARKASAPPPAAQRSSPTPAPLTPRTAEAKEKDFSELDKAIVELDKEDKSHQNGFARPTNGAELDDAVLVNRWRDLGNRAFSSKAEEDDFYRRHPEYVRYRQIAELRSPVDDLVPATKDVADTANAEAAVNRAVDAAKNALGAFNRCADAYQACAGSCAFTKDPAACIAARCRECASEENAVIAAGHEVERRQTMFQSASQNEYTNFSRAIEAAGTAVVPLPAKPQQGVAVFQPRPSPTPSRVSEPVKPAAGVAVFQTKSVAIPVGAAFSAPPTRNWLGAGVAVFSTRTPIPVGGSNSAAPSAYTAQPGTLESTTTQRSGRNWGALLRGLQFGLSIYDGIQASRQPTQGVSPPPKITTGLGVSGVPSAAPVVPPPSKVPQRSAQPAPPSPAMCQNPAALANPHNVTQDGRNVIGSTAPSNYAPLYVPCSQLNK